MKKYEYQIETIEDLSSGYANIVVIQECIDKYTQDGWRLHSCSWNEIGHNAVSVAGFGVNTTANQAVLLFEREISQPITVNKYRIGKTNLSDDIIIPKEIQLTSGSFDSLSILLYVSDGVLQGVKCDVIINDLFGDEYCIRDLYFINFTDDNIYISSAPCDVKIPSEVKQTVREVYIKVKKYVIDDIVRVVDNNELLPLNPALAQNIHSLNEHSIINQIGSLSNAQEIYNYLCDYNQKHGKVFANDFIESVKEIAEYERYYGSMRKSAMNAVERYFRSLKENK